MLQLKKQKHVLIFTESKKIVTKTTISKTMLKFYRFHIFFGL